MLFYCEYGDIVLIVMMKNYKDMSSRWSGGAGLTTFLMKK